jgi:glycosyltransferase involved in cell wall biosynthesis
MPPYIKPHIKPQIKPQIVVSAVNFSEMGPLTILQEILTFLAEHYAADYEIVALVHRQSLVGVPQVTYLEFPAIKGSWLRRLKFEYLDLKRISRGMNARLWLSLHDMTPNVIARRQAVYCHNSSAFFPFRFRDARHDPGFGAFTLFYRFLYAINIKRNAYVIVQQDWMRDRFKSRYGVRNVIVAHPIVPPRLVPPRPEMHEESRQGPADAKTLFFFPAYPRVFKNAELALEAAAILERRGVFNFALWLTFKGTENSYAASLVKRYAGMRSVEFLGLLPRSEVFERYRRAHCLLFPSRLETWGLPISEFKPFEKPILAADLPYARESVGSYDQAAFFDPQDPHELARLMQSVIEGSSQFEPVTAATIAEPFAPGWAGLFEILLSPTHP